MRPCDDHAPKSDAFQAGYMAYERGQDRLTVPSYWNFDGDRDDWRAGWDQAAEVEYERQNHIGGPL